MTVVEHSARHEVAPAPPAITSVDAVPLELIRPNPANPRRRFDEVALQELAASIAQDGLLEPLVVQVDPEYDAQIAAGGEEARTARMRYLLVAGERRWRAAALAGHTSVPVRVLHHVDAQRALRIALVENLARVDLDPIEEAEGYKALQDLGLKQREIAESVKRQQPAIAKAMGLLELPEDVRERIRAGELSVSHGVALLRFKRWPAIVSRIAGWAVEHGWTSKSLEEGVPGDYELAYEGLIRRLTGMHFDPEICTACPFEAKRKGRDGWTTYCLQPEHFDELEAAEQAAWEERARAQMAAAQAAAAIPSDATEPTAVPGEGWAAVESLESVPKIGDLHYSAYERIRSDAPEGCGAHCVCRGRALDRGNLVEICTDPARMRQLRGAETKRQNKEVRAVVKAKLERVTAAIDQLEEIGPRELALLVAAAVSWMNKSAAREGALRHAGGLIDAKELSGYTSDVVPRTRVLADLAAIDLARLGVEWILRHELAEAHEMPGQGRTPRTDWYLDGAPLKAGWERGQASAVRVVEAVEARDAE